MSYSDSFPTQRPKLNLVFNGGSDQLDSRISFSRADTPPTYAAPSAVHYWSNEKHLSSENLISQSADLGSWSQGSSPYTTITSNATAAPDGTTTAAQITGLTGTNKKAIYHPISASTGSYTGIFYVKPNGHEYVQIMFGSVATIYQNFHLSGSGTLGNGTNDAASIDKLGDWYRITITSNALTTASNFYLVMVDSNTAARYEDSTSTSSIFAWGANFSSTNQKVFNSTTSQIHREFAPTLKSVTNAGDPRFEYDPASDGQSDAGSPRGLLIEAQSSNLFARSSGFDYTAAWTKTNVTATAEAISPDGTLNAFAIRENTSASTFKRIHQAATVAAGSVAVSVYAKLLGNERRLVIREDSTTGDNAVFDLSSGTVAATNVGGAGTIESVGNGWYRCTLITSPSGSPGYQFGFWLATATGTTTESYTGDGFSGLLLYGAMCENASASSSLISTSGSTASRASDSCSVALSDIGITSGQDLTAIVEGDAAEIAGAALIGLDDGSSSNYARILRHTNSNYTFDVRTDASSQAVITLGSSSSDTKFAFRLENNNIGAAAGGSAVTTDTSATIGLMTTMQIGNGHWGGAADGTISRVSIYSEALSDANLTALTSS